MSEHKTIIEGVSSVTVRTGDSTTLFMEVENLELIEDDGYHGMETWEIGDYNRTRDTTYAIRGSLVSRDGYYYKVVTPREKKTIVRTAEIDVESFETNIIEAARVLAEAPDGANYTRKWNNFGAVSVRFEWEEEK